MSTEHSTYEGGCQCGKIRYQAQGEPSNTTNCHCTQCRLAAGAAYMTFTAFPLANVTFATEKPKFYESSDKAERGFCPSCGTALSFNFIGSDTINIATLTFDDPSPFPPTDHIFIDSKVSWLVIGDDLPQFPRERDKV